MGASLGIGKDLRLVLGGDDGGSWRLAGTELEWTNMSWTSIAELRKVADERLDIPPEEWPFYDGIELEQDLPVERLRSRLAEIPPEELPDNRWLRELARLLRDGWDFCATSI